MNYLKAYNSLKQLSLSDLELDKEKAAVLKHTKYNIEKSDTLQMYQVYRNS